MKYSEVLTIGTLQGLWADYSFNRKSLKELEGKKVLLVNEKTKRICGVIKFFKPPETYVAKVTYTLEGKKDETE